MTTLNLVANRSFAGLKDIMSALYLKRKEVQQIIPTVKCHLIPLKTSHMIIIGTVSDSSEDKTVRVVRRYIMKR